MNLRLTIIAAGALILFCPKTSLAQTRLEQIYNNMHPSPVFGGPVGGHNAPKGYWDTALKNAERNAIITAGAGIGALATIPFWLPSVIFDEGNLEFGKYPYAYADSCMVKAADCKKDDKDKETSYWENTLITKGWALRATFETGSNFDDLNRFGGQLFLDTNFYRLGFLANMNYYRESNPLGKDPTAFASDWNVTFRITQNEWLQMHVGAGMRTWSSLNDQSAGFNGLYRVEIFPGKPVNMSSLLELGNLDQTFVLHLRTQIGMNWRQGELFLGYDFTRMAGVSLAGPMLGLRLWF